MSDKIVSPPPQLLELFELEKNNSRTSFVSPKISVSGDYKVLRNMQSSTLIIEDNGNIYKTKLDDKFISQIVLRAYEKEHLDRVNQVTNKISTQNEEKISWNREEDFISQMKILRIYLHFNLCNDFENFISKLEREVAKLNAILTPSGSIYGFVSTAYKETNQIAFREQFITKCTQKDSRFDFTESTVLIKNNRITELFKFNNEGCDILLSCGLTYGINNGYGAYSVTWNREFKESKAKILPFKTEDKYRWRNNPRVANFIGLDIDSFVESITEEGAILSKLNAKIELNAKSEKINSSIIMDTYDIILDRVLVAKSSKERVKNYYKETYDQLSNDCRDNIWAVAHSLCFTGTNNKAIPLSMRDLLIKTGTTLLDEGYEQFNNSYSKNSINVSININ